MTNSLNPNTQTTKKPIPTWVKVVIILVILGFGLVTVIGIGLNLLGNYLASGGGEKLIEKGIETVIEKGIEHSGEKELKKIAKDLNVDLGDKGFVIKNDKTGEEFSLKADNKVPDDFPKDIPLFSPANVVTSMTMGGLNMLTLETSASLEEVTEFYKKQLPTQGWQSPFTGSFVQGTFTSLFQKDDKQLTVSIQTENDKTVIVLSNAKTPQGM